MRKLFYMLLPIVSLHFCYAQENEKIHEIEQYIDSITDDVNFAAETSTGVTTNAEGKSVDYSLSYYAIDEKDLFSIVYIEFDKVSLNKIFTFKDGKVIRIVLEKINHDKQNDRVLAQVVYFFDHDVLLNKEDTNNSYPPGQLLNEAKEKLHVFLSL